MCRDGLGLILPGSQAPQTTEWQSINGLCWKIHEDGAGKFRQLFFGDVELRTFDKEDGQAVCHQSMCVYVPVNGKNCWLDVSKALPGSNCHRMSGSPSP